MTNSDQYYIVRCDRAGVFFGKIKEQKMNSIIMTDVRKIFYWEGACAVEQIAQTGVSSGSKLTVVVPEMELASPTQIIPCTNEGTVNLTNQPEWKR